MLVLFNFTVLASIPEGIVYQNINYNLIFRDNVKNGSLFRRKCEHCERREELHNDHVTLLKMAHFEVNSYLFEIIDK